MKTEEPGQHRQGSAVDHIAAASAVPVLAIGVSQLVTPLFAAPFTGFESGPTSLILALQWIVFGGILMAGGVLRIRVVAMFAAEFLFVTGLIAAAFMVLTTQERLPLLVHCGITIIGLVISGITRLADSAELKRDLRFARASAADTASGEIDQLNPDAQTDTRAQ
ncbi:MAG: hypothetical protein WBA51_17170 [Erythrobacter sp.]